MRLCVRVWWRCEEMEWDLKFNSEAQEAEMRKEEKMRRRPTLLLDPVPKHVPKKITLSRSLKFLGLSRLPSYKLQANDKRFSELDLRSDTTTCPLSSSQRGSVKET
ncbi:hypothetical protein Pyn_00746 [Prunus yedoensis var. nudiflora]|uniref:Uncharacterized protein n=1 Tax=Prunus yedoensis var. nudiflora TaxID=2094558 RepID=A0A314U685_PRUYE|nr:hypothetical protein Pyn_00746 [Prunus yedoensis var. nudiflora]